MNAFNPNVNIGDAYKDDYADGYQDDLGSPVLRPKRLHLRLEESPPPQVTEVSRSSTSSSHKKKSSNRHKIRSSLGDAVLIRFMTDGRDPDIANFEADRESLSDRSELDDEEKQDAEPEPENPENTDIDIDDFVETETGAGGTNPHPQSETEQVDQTMHVDMTEALRPTLPGIESLTAIASTSAPVSAPIAIPITSTPTSTVTASYQRDTIMEDSDEDHSTMPPIHYHFRDLNPFDEPAEHDEVTDAKFAECTDTRSRNIRPRPPSPDRPLQSQPPKEITKLAAMALARTDMSRPESRSKDTDVNYSNGKSAAAPPPTERVDRPERTPLPDSRSARHRSATLKLEQQLPSTSAATSPADPSPAYYTSPSNSGHTPASIASLSTSTSASASALSPYATSDQPSPAYSSPSILQHSPRRPPTMSHTRGPPKPLMMPIQPTAYSPPPSNNFEQLTLSPMASDLSGRSVHDKGMESGPLPPIAKYIESREKIESSPAMSHASYSSHPSPGIKLPHMTSPVSPASTYAGAYASPYAGSYASRDAGARDMRNMHSPVRSAVQRPPTLPPLQVRHPLPTSSTIPALSGQQSPLPGPTRPATSAPIHAPSSSTRSHGSHENLHKRHIQVHPIYPKKMLAPMPDLQGQAHNQGQGGQGRTLASTSAATLAAAASSTGGTYKCTVEGCTAAPFVTQYLLNSHANVHSDERPHYCPVEGCQRSKPGSGFKRKNEMIRHGLVHKSPGYVCPYCPDREHKYPRPDNLLRHVRAHHKDKSKDDAELREVLAQRPDGPSRGRRRRN